MGLDMYIYKTGRANGFDYQNYYDNNEQDKELNNNLPPELKGYIHRPYESFPEFQSILHKVAYWRKVNFLHKWFVDNVQNGIDECQLAEITKEKLIEICDILIKARETKNTSLLPTQGGFFFGSTHYDEYYWGDVGNAITQIEIILATTNFDNEIIFYHSSW